MRPLLWLFLLVCVACQPQPSTSVEGAASASPPALTTLVLLRHAEQDTSAGKDPPLNPKGQSRAEALRQMWAATPFDAIYATPYRRTTATAEPLAQAQGLSVTPYDPDQDLRLTAQQFLKDHRGQTMLVVGHSSTIPGLLNVLLGENRYEPLPKSAFGDVWVVNVGDSTQRAVVQLRMD